MTLTQRILTIAIVVLGTVLTRFLPFLLFPAGKPTPKVITYLGKVLAPPDIGHNPADRQGAHPAYPAQNHGHGSRNEASHRFYHR